MINGARLIPLWSKLQARLVCEDEGRKRKSKPPVRKPDADYTKLGDQYWVFRMRELEPEPEPIRKTLKYIWNNLAGAPPGGKDTGTILTSLYKAHPTLKCAVHALNGKASSYGLLTNKSFIIKKGAVHAAARLRGWSA